MAKVSKQGTPITMLIIGIIWVLVGIFVVSIMNSADSISIDNYELTTATVNSVDTNAKEIYLTINVYDKEYTAKYNGEFSNDIEVGDTIKLYYNTTNPEQTKTRKEVERPLKLIGAVLITIGGLLIIGSFFGINKMKKQRVVQRVESIEPERDDEERDFEEKKPVIQEENTQKLDEKSGEGESHFEPQNNGFESIPDTSSDNKYMKYVSSLNTYSTNEPDPYKIEEDPDSIYNTEMSEFDYNKRNN